MPLNFTSLSSVMLSDRYLLVVVMEMTRFVVVIPISNY